MTALVNTFGKASKMMHRMADKMKGHRRHARHRGRASDGHDEMGVRQFAVQDRDGYLIRLAQGIGTRPIRQNHRLIAAREYQVPQRVNSTHPARLGGGTPEVPQLADAIAAAR